MKFNKDIEALRAVESVVIDAVDGDVHWKFVAPTAQRARLFLIQRRLAHRRSVKAGEVGGKRRLPGAIWASLRELTRIRGKPSRDVKKKVHAFGFVMLIYADAITRADESWRSWEDERRKSQRVPTAEDAGKWRYPLSRTAFVRLQDAMLEAGYFQEILAHLGRSSPRDVSYQPPKTGATDDVWYSALDERWRRIVRDAYRVGRELSVIDDYHIGWQRTARAIARLREAVAAAGPELDGKETSAVARYTTRLSATIDLLHDAMPSLVREGYRLPKDPAAMSAHIGEALRRLGEFELQLRPAAYQPRPTSSTGGNRRPRKGNRTRTLRSPAEIADHLQGLERTTPPLDRNNGEWCTAQDAAVIENVKLDSLKRLRQWGFPGAFLGEDEAGRVWRRDGTSHSHPWYLKKSLKKFKP